MLLLAAGFLRRATVSPWESWPGPRHCPGSCNADGAPQPQKHGEELLQQLGEDRDEMQQDYSEQGKLYDELAAAHYQPAGGGSR